MADNKIVKLAAYRLAALEETALDDDFLVKEGLDVLAAYRRIRDDKLRKALRELIFQIARSNEPRRARDDR